MHTYQTLLAQKNQTGQITRVIPGIMFVDGLQSVAVGEILVVENDVKARVMTADTRGVKAMILDSSLSLHPGMNVVTSGEALHIPLGQYLLGKMVNSLGHVKSISDQEHEERRPVEVPPLGLQFRSESRQRFDTGVALVDLMIPLAKGQRELVLGDKKIGKTKFAYQALLTQAFQGSICIYAGIGGKPSALQTLQHQVAEAGVADRCIFVESLLGDDAGRIFLTPYTAMTIAEYFRDQGHDVLIILDNMTRHAEYYREIALLAQAFPGKEAYPGDVFYTHSHLMERAGSFVINNKKVSITCLALAETTEGNLGSYIPTNLMSMTDGHLYFDVDLFLAGRKPAINTLLSVTRVGRQTQTKLERELSNRLLELVAEYQRVQSFLRFGAELSGRLQEILSRGMRWESTLDQPGTELIDRPLAIVLAGLLWASEWQVTQTAAFKELYRSNKDVKEQVTKLIDRADTYDNLIKELTKASATWETLL